MQEIEALIQCHKHHAAAKFLGKCNQQKWDLDSCFRKEKAINRHACPQLNRNVLERTMTERKRLT